MPEANKHELEASAPLLEKIVTENPIQGVVLDLDNTTLKTNKCYLDREYELSMDLAEMFKSTLPSEVFAQRMAISLHEAFIRNGKKPDLITNEYLDALACYFQDYYPDNYSELVQFVKDYLSDFYSIAPEKIEGSVEALRYFKEQNLPFIFNSHGQELWTEMKVNTFADDLAVEAIPYNAVDINEVKDFRSWKQSADKIEVQMEYVLAIGDSLTADILPAIEAGCRYLVWIKGNPALLPFEIQNNPDINIWIVDSVKDLL